MQSELTKYILNRTKRLSVSPEITPGDHGFEMFNDAGTEVEVSEFLYGLVKLVKPNKILETGTHVGVSTVYMAQALKENEKGDLVTFEIIPQHWQNSQKMLQDVEVAQLVDFQLKPSLKYQPAEGTLYDLLFLDSEPQLRFDEFVKYWDFLRPGGYIVIHDLNDQMGHHGQTHHGEYDWPYGDFRVKLGPFIRDGRVNIISFDNPRGMTMFQKTKETAAYYKMSQDD